VYLRLAVVVLLAGCVTGCAVRVSPQPEGSAPPTSAPLVGSVATPVVLPTVMVSPSPTRLPPPNTPQRPSATVQVTLAPTLEPPTMTLPAPESPTPTSVDQAPEPSVDAERVIILIRQRYATINQEQAQYSMVERPLIGFSTEGGTLTGYFAGPSLRKMVAAYFGETGRAEEEYYFWEDQLFFLLRIDHLYDRPFGDVVTTAENRFYFTDGRLIRWIDPDRRFVPASASEFREQQNGKLGQSQQLIETLRSPPGDG